MNDDFYFLDNIQKLSRSCTFLSLLASIPSLASTCAVIQSCVYTQSRLNGVTPIGAVLPIPGHRLPLRNGTQDAHTVGPEFASEITKIQLDMSVGETSDPDRSESCCRRGVWNKPSSSGRTYSHEVAFVVRLSSISSSLVPCVIIRLIFWVNSIARMRLIQWKIDGMSSLRAFQRMGQLDPESSQQCNSVSRFHGHE